ncbi:MAG: CinA family nicotinamide mononucleotide deamidase-related protein [Pseudomonadota bacterium]
MKISLLLTGNELMSGDTVDTNSNYVAQSLKDLNLVPYIKKVVGDDLSLLVSSISELAEVSDVLIINGGLGPTVDDLTAKALSMATDSPLHRHPEALLELEAWAAKRGFILTESNLKQTDLPEICDIIKNPKGSAVGFSCTFRDCLIVCTPGVPGEFKTMVEQQVLPLIREFGHIEATTRITRLRVFGITESGLQDLVNESFPDWPDKVDLGFRVQMPVIEIKIATVGQDLDGLNEIWTEKFRSRFADYVIGRDSTRLSQALIQALGQNNKTISVAESCTGGAVAASITSEAGSSQVFEAGFVVYSDRMKSAVLKVNSETLIEYGAVSEQAVCQLVSGALDVSGADIALAISGIAGPTGGSEEKPVGTVWMAWGTADNVQARRFYFPVGRLAFQRTASSIGMDLVRRELLGLPTDIDYFAELKRRRS